MRESILLRDVRSGFTLVEVMVATVVVGVGVLGFVSVYNSILESTQRTKSHTTAVQLLQEEMEVLKRIPYNNLEVTTNTYLETSFTPPISYGLNYTAAIFKNDIPFQRLIYIQRAEEQGGVIVSTISTAPDLGIKLLTVTLIWTEDQMKKMLQNTSLYSALVATGPATASTVGWIQGAVTTSGAGPLLTGALIVASTNALTATPPPLPSTTGVYCLGTSLENGFYRVEVPGGANYTVGAYNTQILTPTSSNTTFLSSSAGTVAIGETKIVDFSF